jgi:hypothetical protein
LKAHPKASFEGICTGCGYCDDCPQDIQIPRFMDSYNQQLLTPDPNAIASRLKNHWNVPIAQAADCIECGQCEEACTQHLPIIDRLKEIAQKAAN